MKHLFTLCILLGAGLQLFAQITVSNSTFPSIGDTLQYQTDPNPPALNLGTVGGGSQIWDFTSLQGGAVQNTIYLQANAGNGAADFPTANLSTSNTLQSTFFKKTNTVFENLGTSGDDQLNLGIPTNVHYQPALIERRAPMNFFNVNTIETNLNWSIPTGDLADSLLGQLGALVDSFRFRIRTERLDVVDAWGTCNIPNGSFEVLREKRTEMTETHIDVHSFLGWTDLSSLLGGGGSGLLSEIGNDTTLTYHFFSNSSKEEIAVLTVNPNNNQVESAQYKFIPNTVNSTTTEVSNLNLKLSPNPASQSTTLLLEGATSGTYRLLLRDENGRLLQEQAIRVAGSTIVPLELSSFAPGWLSVQILDSKGQSWGTRTLIKVN